MRIAAIVQARFGNLQTGRYPGKVLLPLPTGRTVLEEVLFRCQAIPGVHIVVAAMPDTPDTQPLVSLVRQAQAARRHHGRIGVYLRETGIDPFPGESTDYSHVKIVPVHGPEADVLARYVIAAKAVQADVIVRVTADCPLISPEVCGEVLAAFLEGNTDYACNSLPQTWPHGYDCDVFSRELLERANAAPNRDADGVNTFMRESPDVRRLNVVNPDGDFHHIRLTLDTPADYLTIHHEMWRRIWAWTERENRVRNAA
jgi:spore coat polysaccharide biosynthesis protein SpsF